MATTVQAQRHSGDSTHGTILLDTTMDGTAVAGLTASPFPETPSPAKAETDEEPQNPGSTSDDQSGDEFQSIPNSRPVSTQEQQADVGDKQLEDGEGPEALMEGLNQEEEEVVLGAQQSEDSMHADPQTPSSKPLGSSSDFDEVPLDQTPTAARQSLDRRVSVQENLQKPDLALDTSASVEEPLINVPTHRQTPTIEVSSSPASPDGSDYSNSPSQSPMQSPSISSMPISPMTPREAHMSLTSMESIRLSQSSLDYVDMTSEQAEDALATPKMRAVRHTRKPSSLEILQNTFGPLVRQETFFDSAKDQPLDTPTAEPEGEDMFINTTSAWQSESTTSLGTAKRDSGSSGSDVELDWQTLDDIENQEKEDREIADGGEDESTAFLLARLEQENAKFTVDPKSSISTPTPNKTLARIRSQSRPPSIAQLKKLVSRRDTQSTRYSLTPDIQQQLPVEEPPQMTELEYWAALVQDYPSTASRLPTLTTTKIRAGIPPPLRGVVWTSMSGARDKSLEEAFDKLQDEKSPYEGIINKDVGRSFPGVELFRDAEGEGQRMLGRVLKCFSLHDKDIGYCQGLGFLVGPLLMNMGEKEAFCVLVRLMDHYALRPSFLPSLAGLHMRIFQFSTLLKQHHPELSEHLTELGVEPAYLSQWFLSCFAVTCPLPMLFRIYDVIFAEGANETVMRVALALFRRNEEKMLASTEFEEVMQLLLGRAIWDVYGLNADDLIDDFTSLGGIITHQRLSELEKDFENKDQETAGQFVSFLPDVQAAASRFLGRLWAPSHGHTPSKSAAATLSPESAEKGLQTPGGSILTRPGAFLRRTQSKASIGTINESNGSEGSAANSIISTAPTDQDVHESETRESQTDSMSMKSKADSLRTVSMSTNQAHMQAGIKEQQELHSQIEDLLMALSEMQREHAQMAAMLQKEREERNDDHRVVRKLVTKLGRGRPKSRESNRRSMPPMSRSATQATNGTDKRRTLPARPRETSKKPDAAADKKPTTAEGTDIALEELLNSVQARLESNSRFSASFETKAQLRSNLVRTREQLAAAESQIKDLSERAEFSETSLMTFQNESESLRSEVEELRTRVNDDFKEKQKLELTIQNMDIQMRLELKAMEKKQRTARLSRTESSSEVPTTSKSSDRSRTGSISSTQSGSASGLRELKLGRRDSVGSIQSIRSMKGQRLTSEWPQSPPAINASPSPPNGEVEVSIPATPPPIVEPADPLPTPKTPAHKPSASLSQEVSTPLHKSSPSLSQKVSHTPSASLSVPDAGGFARRTSSLATQAVLATPAHEVVPEEALLLELVNSKTAEAQARQEIDELRRALQVQKRRADETLLQIQAEVASAKLEAEAARAEARKAREETQITREELFDASPLATPMSGPVTPSAIDDDPLEGSSKRPEPRKADTAPASGGVGWFWSRRTASTTKAVME